MKRRGFLKGLASAVAIPVALKEIVAKPELSNLEKAQKIDSDFNSPFLYVEAVEDLKQGDVVMFAGKSVESMTYRVKRYNDGLSKAAGISCADVKKGNWYFVQTVGHCKLPARKENYFKTTLNR